MAYTKVVTNADTGKTEVVPLTADEIAEIQARVTEAKRVQDAADAIESAKQADFDLVRKATAALTQLQADLAAIDTMTATQVRDVVKHSITIQIGMIKALQRIL